MTIFIMKGYEVVGKITGDSISKLVTSRKTISLVQLSFLFWRRHFGMTKRKRDFAVLFRYNEKNVYICGVGFGITKRYEYNQEADIFG